MSCVGFFLVKERWKEGGKVGYWLFKKDTSAISPQRLSIFSKKMALRDGTARNNFCILLS
jgi:25S rRNA (adenine2142-N1)-methyltransferase